MNIKEESLSKALSFVGIPELPKAYREGSGDVWLEALVLVRKMNTTQSYCIAERSSEGKITYKKDFGTMSPILGLVSIHPYKILDIERFIPYKTIEQKRKAVVDLLGNDMKAIVDSMTDSEVETTMLELAIEQQKQVNESMRDGENLMNMLLQAKEETKDSVEETNTPQDNEEPKPKRRRYGSK